LGLRLHHQGAVQDTFSWVTLTGGFYTRKGWGNVVCTNHSRPSRKWELCCTNFRPCWAVGEVLCLWLGWKCLQGHLEVTKACDGRDWHKLFETSGGWEEKPELCFGCKQPWLTEASRRLWSDFAQSSSPPGCLANSPSVKAARAPGKALTAVN
jgi:hypothetical protein